jgi:hypothetical protein
MLAQLFYNPIILPSSMVLYLLIPICASVALVYKAVRVIDIRHFWKEVALLMIYMIGGLTALGVGLWAIQEYWP